MQYYLYYDSLIAMQYSFPTIQEAIPIIEEFDPSSAQLSLQALLPPADRME